MSNKHTVEEENELNATLKKWQTRAKRLILSNYYDSVVLNDLKYTILDEVTNAKSYKDINSSLWNSGMIENVLDDISTQIKKVHESYYRMDKRKA